MNDTLTTAGRHDQHLHQPAPPLQPLGTVDRVALFVGVALIRWTERPRTPRPQRPASHEDAARAQRELQRVHTRCAEYSVLVMRVR